MPSPRCAVGPTREKSRDGVREWVGWWPRVSAIGDRGVSGCGVFARDLRQGNRPLAKYRSGASGLVLFLARPFSCQGVRL
jgi:hypothetical protein